MQWAVAAIVVAVAGAWREEGGRRLMAAANMSMICIDFEGAPFTVDDRDRPVVTNVSSGFGVSGGAFDGAVYITSDNACDTDSACLFDANCGVMGLPDCVGGDSDLSSPDQETIIVNCARHYTSTVRGGDCGEQRRPNIRTCDSLEESDLTRDLTGECNSLMFDFEDVGLVDIMKLTFVDLDEPAYIQAFDMYGTLVAPTVVVSSANGVTNMEPFDLIDVKTFKVHFSVSGGLDDVCFKFSDDAAPLSYSFDDLSFSYSYSYDAFTDAFAPSYSFSYSYDAFTDTFRA